MRPRSEPPVTCTFPAIVAALCILPATLLTHARAQDQAGSMDRSDRQWAPFLEWSLANPSYEGNPFDLEARATFVHAKTGETHVTGMYYAGADRWTFRFTATRSGRWTFRTTSADGDLAGKTGTVTIEPNDDTYGFVTHVGRKWARPKGRSGRLEAFVPQLVMYDGPHRFFRDPSRIDADIRVFLVEHGFVGFHVPVFCRWFDLDQDRATAVRSDDPNPDPRTFEALELLITKVHAAGGIVHLWAWGDEQRRMTPARWGINGKVDRRLQRYVAARLGPIPGWTLGYGFDLWEWVSGNQLTAWHGFLQAEFGWPHLLGARASKNRLDQLSEALDYSGYEQHRPDYTTYVETLARRPNKPSMSEDRFRIRRPSPYPDKDYTSVRTRRGLWHSVMAGGVANIWGNLVALEAGAPARDGSYPYSDRHWIKTNAEFFRGRFFADMVTDDSLTDGVCLRRTGSDTLLFYKEDASSIRMDLSAMESARLAVAVDALRPYAEIPIGMLPPGQHTWMAPHASDWAIAVGGGLTFTNITATAGTAGPTARGRTGGHGAMFADVDRDGHPDLYVTMIFDDPMPELFYRNIGDRRFIEEGRARGIADFDGGSHGACFADLDNDGDYDLFNGTTWDHPNYPCYNNLFRNDGNGQFTDVTPTTGAWTERRWPTRATLTFDMDADGDLDLFCVTNYQGSADPPDERNEVYRNDGGMRFTPVEAGALSTAPCGQGATDSDFDGDGDIDVLAANRSGDVNLLRNDGKGRFTRIVPASVGIRHRASDGITTGDVNHDGRLDMMLAGDDTGHLYLNRGDGRFAHAQSFEGTDGYMGGFADLDQDGDVDLVFAGDEMCWLNDGTGRFVAGPAIPLDGANDPRGIAFADIDADGDLDFAIGCKRSGNRLIGTDGARGSWLKVRLTSPQGQAGAFGAKTTIYATGATAGRPLGMRESRSNNGYLGQDDPVLHFGLGAHVEVDVVVRFLDGTTITRRNVAANQTVDIDPVGGARPIE